MTFALSEYHQQKKEEFRRFAAAELDSGSEFPWTNLNRAAAKGYMGLPLPKEWGGGGEDFLTYILLIEAVSAVCASTGVIMAVHTSVGTYPLFLYGRDEQKKRYLEKLARGEMLGAFALTETGAGSDAAAITTTATRVKGGYRINGCKIFITGGGEADLYTVFALVSPPGGRRAMAVFLVEKGAPGLEVSPPERKMGLNRSATTALYFNDLFVPEENRLGEEGAGFGIAMSLLDGGRIGIAAQGLGLAGACLDYTAALLKKRIEADIEVGQGSLFTLADLSARKQAAALLTYRAAVVKGCGRRCTGQASMAKLFSTDLAVEAAARCLDLAGLEGMSDNNPLARYFRDAKVTQIYEGSNQIQRIVIARELPGG